VTGPISVILIDSHPVVAEGLRGVLNTYSGIEVVGVAFDVETALPLVAEKRPTVVLLDINMPTISGIDAISMVKARHHAAHVVMLSMHDTREYISSSILRGASGYVLKDVPTAEIVEAIEAVARGQTYFSPAIRETLLSQGREAQPEKITQREHEVATLIASGKSNRDISGLLGISEATVETHRKNLKRKLGVSSTAELVRFVLEHPERLVTLPSSG